jgi:hypothetical protein
MEPQKCELTADCPHPAYFQSMFVFIVPEGRFAWGCEQCLEQMRIECEPVLDRYFTSKETQ